MAVYGSQDVLCPFYLSEVKKKRTIRCEGYADGSTVSVLFARDKKYNIHRNMYCCSVYDQCPYYKLLLDKYNKL